MIEPGLRRTILDTVEPLDAQMGVWPPKTVPEDFEPALFGKGDADENLFALLEGARLPRLVTLLEAEELPNAFLFQGKVAEDLGDDQPVIVQFSKESALLRMLLTDHGDDNAPTGLLPKQAGYFLRSPASLDQMRRHLRHFTQVLTDEETRIFFRFWEPASAAVYFDVISSDHGQVARWFTHASAPISQVVIPFRMANGWALHIFEPALPADTQPAQVRLTAHIREMLRLARFNANVLEATILLCRTFPEVFEHEDARALQARLDQLYRSWIPMGFHSKKALFLLATWETLYGPQFEKRDREGKLAHYLNSPGLERDRIQAMRTRLETLPEELFLSPDSGPGLANENNE